MTKWLRGVLSAALSLIAASSFAAVTINVDVSANRHAIDPRIYGAAWADATQITQLGLTLNRWGGNAMSRYNWSNDTANRCKDYFFYNIHNGGANGASADTFIGDTLAAGAQPVMTIPMLSLLPKDNVKRCSFPFSSYPNQEAYITDEIKCGNGRSQDNNPNQDGPRILGVPDPSNIAQSYPLSHQGDWIDHINATWDNQYPGGVNYYSLDNEPGLWSFDHWDVHPSGTTYDEVWGKMSELGAIIREKDPSAIITGGEEWGWSGYFQSGLDMEGGTADADAHGGTPYYDWLLDQFKEYEDVNGTRILDVWTAHFYPQNGEFWDADNPAMREVRNRSTRALWDPTYTDESWMNCCFGGKVMLIPRLKAWVTNHYPGTLIGITEYNWGDTNDMNAGTTQADILGIFGREGLDVGVRWSAPAVNSFVGGAFKVYRNYDGAGAKFGETSVTATVPDPDSVSAFASQRTSDSALTIVLINKDLTTPNTATVNLANFTNSTTIQRWQLSSASTNVQHLSDLAAAGNSVVLTLPAKSVTLLVVPSLDVPPPSLTATASSTSQVALSWTAVSGAISYEIQRSFNNSAFSTLTTVGTTTHNDTSLTANTTYLYKVRANLAGGPGSFSNMDPATTTVFTDATLTSGMPVKLAHLSQLRTAVNAMRASAGLTAQVFTDDPLSTSTTIKATHVNQLRTALDQARTQLSLSALGYTDSPATTATTVKAVHINELRNGVK
jgi:hypothetical protein